MAKNINRDNIIRLYSGLDKEIGKIAEVLEQPEIKFYDSDLNSSTIYFFIKPLSPDIDVTIGIVKPDKSKLPVFALDFMGLTDDLEYVFLLDLKQEQINQVGKYGFTLWFSSEGKKVVAMDGTFRVVKNVEEVK
ncbi:MAG: hypothetical protein MSA56_10130 [Clostridium sp.]|nr:hypothetical protein [Clostridium sp.]